MGQESIRAKFQHDRQNSSDITNGHVVKNMFRLHRNQNVFFFDVLKDLGP